MTQCINPKSSFTLAISGMNNYHTGDSTLIVLPCCELSQRKIVILTP